MSEQSLMHTLRLASALQGADNGYWEVLYESYLKDPRSVSDPWRAYFDALPQVSDSLEACLETEVRAAFLAHAKRPSVHTTVDISVDTNQLLGMRSLIDAFRRNGHFAARLDPLGMQPPAVLPSLSLAHHGFAETDRQASVKKHGFLGLGDTNLGALYEALQKTYCGSIGFEYQHLRSVEEIAWLQARIETRQYCNFSESEKKATLRYLSFAEGLEHFLAMKYVGQKRFGLEGGEVLIPLLHEILSVGAEDDLFEMVLGMAHRGRLNVLFNFLGLSAEELCAEFEGKKDYGLTSGDVKYHMGFSSDLITKNGPVHLSLAFNPSHLEFISAVVMGSVRARQDRQNKARTPTQVMPVLIHGDAAFAGQGIVMETLNMSQTPAYYIAGTVHIVLNNQIGFTTNPNDSRSMHYCTDFAKAINAPVLHVNGDDPEAVLSAARLAVHYRNRFRKDVVIDCVCYRRLGHNEADEPLATQPLMYQTIKKHPSVRALYAERLEKEGVCSLQNATDLVAEARALIEKGGRAVQTLSGETGMVAGNMAAWSPYIGKHWKEQADTRVPLSDLSRLAEKLCALPETYVLQQQVQKLMENRQKMANGSLPLDWGFAEMMAYASLLDKGYLVRLVGQDSCRGTFVHRHAVVYDQNTNMSHTALAQLSENQGRFEIYNSVLSEAGALGFEYGYAVAEPNALVIWEAQFGDFANGAQVIIDQFISSGWQKWQRLCGLVLFLPHGYEGMGPEHSSARLERYLQLAAQQNIQVCVPTTAAQIFHLLRRQVLRKYRRPLVVMTPKSLLRHKGSVSSLEDLAEGSFEVVLPEIDPIRPNAVKRVILCSGKVYYDLLEVRRREKLDDIAIIRIEQLYPFPYEALIEQITRYKKAKEIIWCQEEPKNQGAWYSRRHSLEACLQGGRYSLQYVGRKSSAAPAVGYSVLHAKQQTLLVQQALGLEPLDAVL